MSEYLNPSTLLGALALVALVSSAVAVARSSSTRTRTEVVAHELGIFTAANNELRARNEELITERERERRECRSEIAELRGQLTEMRSSLVMGLVDSIKTAIVDAIHDVAANPDRRKST